MLLIIAVAYFWFERSGANVAARQKSWLEVRRHTPRLSPKVEDDERRLKNLEVPTDPTQVKSWEEDLKRDLEKMDRGSN
jgi:hypothetical protein